MEIQRLQDRLNSENLIPPSGGQGHEVDVPTISESPAIRETLAQIEQVAPTPATVLLLGETGTGKEVMAQAIHDLSPRHQRPMIRVSCAAIPTALIESELFGRERGAYTGALSRQIGRFEAANQSTLFLDEIGDLPMEVQVKLLRVLQERVIERLGSTQPIKVDVRIIAATNRNLEDAVRDKTFREDLFYRLNVFPIVVPPLRERVEDIPALVWSFIDEFSRSFGKTIESISKESMRELQRYPWPGNVRELRNVIERAVIVATGRQLVVSAPRLAERPMPQTAMTLSALEVEHIRAVLESTQLARPRTGRRGGASRPQADDARKPDGQARHHAQEGQLTAGSRPSPRRRHARRASRSRRDLAGRRRRPPAVACVALTIRDFGATPAGRRVPCLHGTSVARRQPASLVQRECDSAPSRGRTAWHAAAALRRRNRASRIPVDDRATWIRVATCFRRACE